MVEYKNPKKEGWIREHKDSLTEVLIERDYVANIGTDDEILYKIEFFFENSNVIESIATINEDGTYTEIIFDKFGKQIGKRKLDENLNIIQ